VREAEGSCTGSGVIFSAIFFCMTKSSKNIFTLDGGRKCRVKRSRIHPLLISASLREGAQFSQAGFNEIVLLSQRESD